MGKNSEEFIRNFLKQSLKTLIPQKSLILGTNSGDFSRTSEKSVTGNGSPEIPRKFLEENHHSWRIWGNSSLLLLG